MVITRAGAIEQTGSEDNLGWRVFQTTSNTCEEISEGVKIVSMDETGVNAMVRLSVLAVSRLTDVFRDEDVGPRLYVSDHGKQVGALVWKKLFDEPPPKPVCDTGKETPDEVKLVVGKVYRF
jgi:hypothetical protein